MPILNINRKKVHFQEINPGGATTILMIHGMLGNLSVYYYRIAPILAKRYHVVMYDLKSHGMSERVDTGYDFQSMAEDAVSLMEALRLPSFHLVGYSFGALIALQTAIRFPGKIRKLSVIEGPDPFDPEPFAKIGEYSRKSLETYAAGVTDIFGRKIGARQLERTHQLYEYMFKQTSIRYDMLKERDFFASGGIDDIPHETLLIYGKDSGCVPAGQALSGKIRKSKLVLFDGDHQIPLREPVGIGRELDNFFMD
ncbi:MAG TPA: alpha/beta hydrolase [Puia sp.]|jgi:pimeloyl-ACP methyl ester carboxylesterase|nr:alpha/beta hydrolase [Puia sp.]